MQASIARPKPILVALVAASMSLSACATNPDGSSSDVFTDIGTVFGSDADLTPEQRALREREREYSESRLASLAIGVGAGAVIGGVLGYMLGGSDGAALGAGLGAAAGGAAGYVGGTYLTRDHQDFVASRDSLQADIETAQEDTAAMRRNVQVAESALSAQRGRIDRLNAELRAGTISEEQARAQAETAADDLASVRALAEESERRVANLQQSVNSYRQAGISPGNLDAQLQEQKRQAQALRRIERSMIGVIDRTPANIRPAVVG
jgi:outer membrane lipoprotein SlyB